MRLIVQKYGGTSVGTPERIRAVAQRLIDTQRDNCRVVAAISAMAGVTDNLIKLAQECFAKIRRSVKWIFCSRRASTAQSRSLRWRSMLWADARSRHRRAGWNPDDRVHTKAKIANITPRQIQELLADDYIVIVAGFQGQTPEGETTTLGRAATDLTAIALAGALKADACQIFTDVDGVFTCDPRVVAEAKKIDEIAYDELLEMAGAGSKVMQSRAVEFAKKFGVPFEVRSSFKGEAGNDRERGNDEHGGCRHPRRQHRSQTSEGHDHERAGPSRHRSRAFFPRSLPANIIVDMIVQNVSTRATTDISFTIHEDDLETDEGIARPVVKEIGATELDHAERRRQAERRRHRHALAFRSRGAACSMSRQRRRSTFS